MCRLLGFVSTSRISLELAAGPHLPEFLELSRKHADGWGFARSDGRIDRETEPAHASPRFQEVAARAATEAAILHFRWATPGLGIRLENTHPFTGDGCAFSHNGAIFGDLESLIPADRRDRLIGDTDSEKYFQIALAFGLPEAVKRISRACDYTSLNAMMLTPTELIVACQYRPERIASGEPADYYDLRYQVRDGQITLASTGWTQDGWKVLPNRSVTRIDRSTLVMTTE